jgi:hypothetical protein
MCGRYVVKHPTRFMANMHRIAAPLFEARYNVAPSQLVPVVKAGEAGVELAMMRWGLIPSWAKDAKIAYKLINARGETVASKRHKPNLWWKAPNVQAVLFSGRPDAEIAETLGVSPHSIRRLRSFSRKAGLVALASRGLKIRP